MDQILQAERLDERAKVLAEGTKFNGFKLGYITLEADPHPSFAWLDVEFQNQNALATVPPPEAFRVEGGERPDAHTRVSVVQPDPDGNPAVLRLTIKPVGDYSTYILTTVASGASATTDKLPAAMDPIFNRLPFKFRPGCFSINCAPEGAGPPPPDLAPGIDYLARDYDSFRHVLMSGMAARVRDWSPTSEADLDQVLIDLIAARADELADAHDRVLAERSIATARKRVSLARHARLMDYHIHQGNQATTVVAVEVDADMDLPPAGKDAWVVRNVDDWKSPQAVIFATFQNTQRWRRRAFRDLSDLRLYTWSGTVSALPRGATSADLMIAGATSQASAQRLCDYLNFADASQLAAAGTDVDANVDRLLIEEVLNPATGTENGRNPQRRQLLHLVPKDSGRATTMQDPVTKEWFCRVQWLEADALRDNFCFIADCGGVSKLDISRFFGNLADVAHGRPQRTTFVPKGSPLASADDSDVVALHCVEWKQLCRQRGPDQVQDGALAVLPWAMPSDALAFRYTVPGGDTPALSTLAVSVDSPASWDELPDLINADGAAEQYVVETDEMQRSVIRFGNGTNGKPLPPHAKVVCRYQTGQPLAGNVGADTLHITDVPGVTRVHNPLDVTNGRDPEPRDDIVRRAPEAYRKHQLRAVTLADYADAAEKIAGVSHARARYAWCGSWRAVQVMIDPVGGGALSLDLTTRLEAALDALRLIGDDVEFRSAVYVPLDIKLVLCAHPAYWIEDLRAELSSEFSYTFMSDGRPGFFNPDLWSFGDSLHASQLIGRALKVQGVDRALRVSIRRFNPGSGGGLTTITLDPAAMPESLPAVLPIGPFEILIVANDPDALQRGRISFDIQGGRR